MDPMVPAFKETVKSCTLHPPQLPYYSTIKGRLLRPEEAVDPDYWVYHVRRTVRFQPAVEALLDDGHDLLLECGPGEMLVNLARQCRDDAGVTWIPGLSGQEDDQAVVFEAAAALYERGADLDWKSLYAPARFARADVPRYPFQRRCHWLEGFPEKQYRPAASSPAGAAAASADDGLPAACRARARAPARPAASEK